MKTFSPIGALAALSGLSGLSALSFQAAAFQPLITDDTGTQGAGGNQLEFAIGQDKAKSAGETMTTRALPLVYTRGLTDSLDGFIQANHTRTRSTDPTVTTGSGSGNASFGVKWRFFENEASKTSLAIKPEVRLPISGGKEAERLGVGRTSYGLTAVVTQEVGFGAIHANLFEGRDRFRDTTTNPNNSTTRLSVAPVWDVAEGWKLALDLGVQRDRAGGVTTRTRIAEAGVIYSPSKELDFAFGLVRRNNNASPSTKTDSVTAGVTWRFK